jgi:hypothetical protein
MRSPSGFSKTLLCPSAEELLSFIIATGSTIERCEITAHLAECSFCDAELRFLSKYPPPPPTYEPIVMPDHLRLLAQCLLSDAGIAGLPQLSD